MTNLLDYWEDDWTKKEILVSDINGPIEVGDGITSSEIPGVGMKATEAGVIVGKALESFGLTLNNAEERRTACPKDLLSLGGAARKDSGQSSQEENNYHQSTGDIEKQQSNIGLIESHTETLLTDTSANTQQPTLSTTPNNTEIPAGLSSEGIKSGTTVEPKNNVPRFTNTSANLSNWESENRTINSQDSTESAELSTPLCGKIMVFVNVGWYDPGMGKTLTARERLYVGKGSTLNVKPEGRVEPLQIENWTLKVDSGNVGIGINPEKPQESARLGFSAIDTASGEVETAYLWYDADSADSDELKSSQPMVTASGSFDIAEDFATRDPRVEAGDVVVIAQNNTSTPGESPDQSTTPGVKDEDTPGVFSGGNTSEVFLASQAYDSAMVGIVSQRPGIRLSQGEEETSKVSADLTLEVEEEQAKELRYVPVALAGRVKVKIASTSAAIKPGDYLTSSDEPGKAMRATRAGYVIGKALESYDTGSKEVHDPVSNPGSDRILVLVNLSYYAGEESVGMGEEAPDGAVQGSRFEAQGEEEEDQETSKVSEDLTLEVKKKGAELLDDIKKDAKFENLDAETATISGSLQVLGETVVSELGVTGEIRAGLLVIEGLTEELSPDPAREHLGGDAGDELGEHLQGGAKVTGASQGSRLKAQKENPTTSNLKPTTTSGASISTLSGPLKLQENALGNLEIMGSKIVFDTKGNVLIKEGVIKGSEKMRNAITVPAKITTILIENGGDELQFVTDDNKLKFVTPLNWSSAPVTINVTPSWETTVWVEEITKDGFIIKVGTAPEKDGKVYWLAVW